MDEKNVDDSAEKMPPPPSRQEQATIEKAEEQKLRANLAKYPQVNKIILTLSILKFFFGRVVVLTFGSKLEFWNFLSKKNIAKMKGVLHSEA